MIGPGTLDADVAALRKKYGAHGVVLIVLPDPREPALGGMSTQATLEVMRLLPTILREAADEQERDSARFVDQQSAVPS